MKMQIIVGSTRPGRVSDRVAQWVATEAKALPDTTVEIIDLADYKLPFFDESISPQYNPSRKPDEVVATFLAKLSEADGYVIVTPEYNRSIPGVLKNALDFLAFEMKQKPVSIVAHGSTGGAQAAAQLRNVIVGLQAVALPTTTYVLGRASELIDESGELVDEAIRSNPYGPQAALQGTVNELKWYADALSAARK